MLQIEAVASGYGRIAVLHGVTLEVAAGEIVALVGANGAGKTTLLRAVSGVQPISAGRILLSGADLARRPAHARVAAGLGHVLEGRQVFGPLSVEDNLRLGAYTRRDTGIGDDLERMFQLFPILAEKRALAAGGLSGGQQQMLALARALMSRPKLLLLDEPSMGLAPVIAEQIFAVLRRLRGEGTTMLLVEQNAFAALSIADRGYVMETGRIVLAGPGRALLADPRIRASYLGV